MQKIKKNSPGYMYEASMVFYNESLYLFGLLGNETFNSLFRYNLETENWEKLNTNMKIEARRGHKAAVYDKFMFVFFGYLDLKKFSEIWKLDLETLNWQLIKTSAEYIYGSTSQIGSNWISFGLGKTVNGYQNSIKLFYLDTEIYHNYVDSADFPTSRKNHVAWTYNGSIYTFGGISNTGKHLNDMWRYDISTNKWFEIKTTGDIPEARELPGWYFINGSGLILYGGRSSSSILSDLFLFEPKSSKWSLLSDSKSSAIPRYSSCISFIFFTVIIYGGVTSNSQVHEIWIYRFDTDSFQQVEIESKTILDIKNFRCVFDNDGLTLSIFLFGGNDLRNEVNQKVYKVVIRNYLEYDMKAVASLEFENRDLMLSEFALEVDYPYVYLFGGRINQQVSQYVFALDYTKKKIVSKILVPSELWITGHTVTQLGEDFYIFGGSPLKTGFRTSSFLANQLLKISINDSDFHVRCRFGLKSDDKCELCQPGFYSFGSSCLPCPPGTFYPYKGASERQMCTPCGFGEYNDKPGRVFCKKCKFGDFCPIGSNQPSIDMLNLQSYKKQPADYKVKSSFLNDLYTKLIWAFIGLALFLLFVLTCSNKSRIYFQKLDMFVNQHSQELNVPVTYRKTSIGGYFTIIFILFSIITSIYTLISFIDDNISESQSLVPSLTYSSPITASVTFTFTFYHFNGYCTDEYFKIQETFIHYSDRSIKTFESGKNCIGQIKYKDFSIDSSGKLESGFKAIFAYCSYISLHIISSSSVPKESSEVFIPIFPSNFTHLFRGFAASEFQVEFIPSVSFMQVFYSDSNLFDDELTGFHLVDRKNHVVGDTVDQNS